MNLQHLQQVSPQNAIAELQARRAARSSLLDFTRYTFPDYDANWHHELICKYLDMWVKGEITRLIINTPPRHGKSELVSRRLPAYILGKYPNAKFMSASYAASLSQSFNRDVQRIIDSAAYKCVFPDTTLFGSNVRTLSRGTYLRNSSIFEIVGYEGQYINAGVGGGLTGFGFDFGGVDDPFKDAKEANSETIRKSKHDWWDSVFWTRQAPGAGILLTNTRWHMDDTAGHLISRMETGDGDVYVVINLPAIMEDLDNKHPDDPRDLGEALWPDRYPLEFLQKTRANNEFAFSALYQQKPIAYGQSMFKVDKLKANTLDEAPVMIEAVRFYDLAVTQKKHSDYTAGVKLGKTLDNRIIILDMYRAQKVMPETEKSIIANAIADGKSVRIRLEGEKAGIVQLDYLVRRDELQGFTIDKEPPVGSKEARAGGFATQLNNGQVYIMRGNWNQALFDELEAFPLGAHDDQVDALSGGYDMLTTNNQAKYIDIPNLYGFD